MLPTFREHICQLNLYMLKSQTVRGPTVRGPICLEPHCPQVSQSIYFGHLHNHVHLHHHNYYCGVLCQKIILDPEHIASYWECPYSKASSSYFHNCHHHHHIINNIILHHSLPQKYHNHHPQPPPHHHHQWKVYPTSAIWLCRWPNLPGPKKCGAQFAGKSGRGGSQFARVQSAGAQFSLNPCDVVLIQVTFLPQLRSHEETPPTNPETKPPCKKIYI